MRFVDERSVRAALAALSPALQAELLAIAGALRVLPEVALVVFEVEAEGAFDSFPVVLSTYDAHGDVHDCSLDGRSLLPGRTLLPPRDAYPLGRIDFLGADTTPDLELVERAIVEQLLALWPRLERVRAYAGRIQVSDGGPEPSSLVSLDDGALHVVTLRWG
ncbi:hypothetical protein OV090_10540 [Nannocystis sp. RBIL2]|uniref:hypothetical protein n=1 Tax=Nannocystis sp. RBIL2 TaxID=2996788 RepID=UPI00226E1696|nr:hypothetical protein [Nannocystis sp. RBIL2]MCY1065201.1 hypothetical protein [Nannocystis sp. RBIL2]